MNICSKTINKLWSQNRKSKKRRFLKKVYINDYAYRLNVKKLYKEPDNSSRGRKEVADV